MWQGWAESRRRCGRGGPSPGADVAGVSPVPAQMWQGWAESRRRCGSRERGVGACVGGVGRVPAQMWQRRGRGVALLAETDELIGAEAYVLQVRRYFVYVYVGTSRSGREPKSRDCTVG